MQVPKQQEKKKKNFLTQNRCGPVVGPWGGVDMGGAGLRSGHGAPYRPGQVLEQ